jgi:hypothetical protein
MIRCATLSHRVDRHANARNRRGRQALAPSAADFPTAEIRAHQSAPARTASRHEAAHLRLMAMGSCPSLVLSRGSARAASVARGSRRAAACRWTRASLVSRPGSGRGVGSPAVSYPHVHVLHPHAPRLARRAPRRTRYRDQHTRGRARCAADTDPRHAANGDRPQRRRAQAATSSHPADQDPSSGAHSTRRRPGGQARRCGVERCELRGSQPSSASRRESRPRRSGRARR